MKRQLLLSMVLTPLLSIAAQGATDAAQEPGEKYEGVLSQLTSTIATLDNSKSFRFDPKVAKCFDFRGDKTTCETLIGVGYANRARITVIGNVVQRIDILDLQQ